MSRLPEVFSASLLFLNFPVTTASAEQSFPKLVDIICYGILKPGHTRSERKWNMGTRNKNNMMIINLLVIISI